MLTNGHANARPKLATQPLPCRKGSSRTPQLISFVKELVTATSVNGLTQFSPVNNCVNEKDNPPNLDSYSVLDVMKLEETRCVHLHTLSKRTLSIGNIRLDFF